MRHMQALLLPHCAAETGFVGSSLCCCHRQGLLWLCCDETAQHLHSRKQQLGCCSACQAMNKECSGGIAAEHRGVTASDKPDAPVKPAEV